jgi:hypothetical protein
LAFEKRELNSVLNKWEILPVMSVLGTFQKTLIPMNTMLFIKG